MSGGTRSASLAGLRIDPDVLDRLPPLERERVAGELRAVEEAFKANPLIGYHPHGKQAVFHAPPFPPSRLFLGGNRSGKSTATMVDTVLQCIDADVVPDHLKAYKRWDPPFYARVVTPDLTHTMDGVVLQKFREWCPKKQLQGGSFDRAWDKTMRMLRFKNGSWVQFFSNDQDLEKFGGAALHRIVYDEEPRSDIRRECLMRLIDYGGEELYGMTPLHGMCVDVETECLTKRGWKRHFELEIGEPVLTYNVERGATEWAPLLGIYRDEAYSGEMHRTPGHLDSMFTPDHKWVTERGLVPWSELKKTDRAVVARPHSNLNVDLVSATFWELVGWFLSEGSVVKGENKMVIYQSLSRYPEHCETIERILLELGAQYHIGDMAYRTGAPGALATKAGTQRRFVITGDLARQLRWVVGYPKRLRPEVVTALSQPALEALLAGLLGGDGHVCASGKWEFTSCEKDLADAVSMVGVLLGRRTNIRRYNSPAIRDRGQRPVYRVTGSGREHICEFKRRAVPCEAPEGGVWCPSTPNQTWVARRGGTAFITGNSWVYDQFFEPWEKGTVKEDEVRIVVVDMDDNPHLDQATMKWVLSGLTREEREARKSGRFVAFAGLIYHEFHPSTHVIPDAPIPDEADIYVGIDAGLRHPAVVYTYLDQQDNLVVFDEIAPENVTIETVCKRIHERNAVWKIQPRWYIIDPAVRNRNNQTGRSDQDEFASHGIVAIPGQNAVSTGINKVKQRLENEKLFVMARCETLRSEFKKYRWQKESTRTENEPRDAPVKAFDHCLDALRYVAMQRPMAPLVDAPKPSDTMKDRLLRHHLRRLRSPKRLPDNGFGAGIFQ